MMPYLILLKISFFNISMLFIKHGSSAPTSNARSCMSAAVGRGYIWNQLQQDSKKATAFGVSQTVIMITEYYRDQGRGGGH